MDMPNEGVVDAHVHLWRRARTPQDWIDPVSMPAIDRDFWLSDLERILETNGVSTAVVVQASNSDLETEDLLGAALPASVGAVVGWLDLDSEGVADRIATLRALPEGTRLAGIRHLAHIDPDPHWLRRPAVDRGLGELEAAGLVFDLVVTPEQLPDAIDVTARHPGLLFVLDHLAKPAIRSGDYADWEHGLRTLARRPNVYAKFSGLTMEADWNAWQPSDLSRATTVALDAFGPERLMFGSDWPLVEVCGGYTAWLAAARSLVSMLGAAERWAIFSGTARSAYRIEEHARG